MPPAPEHRGLLLRGILRRALWTLALLAIGAVATLWFRRELPRPAVATPARPPPTVTQIQKLAALVTSRVTLCDARETTISGHLGHVRALLVVRGEVLLGPDMEQARIVSVDEPARKVVLELPTPRVLSARLDHQGTHLVGLTHGGFWVIAPGDAGRTPLLNRAYAEAEQAIQRAAANPELLGTAMQHTEAVIRAFIESTGWTFEIRWR